MSTEEGEMLVVVDLTPTARRKASCPTFSLWRAIIFSIFFFSSSILFLLCSNFMRTLFNCEAIASGETAEEEDDGVSSCAVDVTGSWLAREMFEEEVLLVAFGWSAFSSSSSL